MLWKEHDKFVLRGLNVFLARNHRRLSTKSSLGFSYKKGVYSVFKAKTLLWTELCLPQIHMLNPYLPKEMVLKMEVLGDNWVYMRSWGWGLHDVFSTLIKRDTKELFFSSLPACTQRLYERMARWKLLTSHEKGSHQKLTMLIPWPWSH